MGRAGVLDVRPLRVYVVYTSTFALQSSDQVGGRTANSDSGAKFVHFRWRGHFQHLSDTLHRVLGWCVVNSPPPTADADENRAVCDSVELLSTLRYDLLSS